MQIVFISVGKKHEEIFRDAIEEYTNRIERLMSTSWIIIPGEIENEKDKLKGIEKEGEAIIKRLESGDKVILLDEKGKPLNTLELSSLITEAKINSVKRLVFIIGGAYGVGEVVRNRSEYIWSLSKLTFPHMLVRLILSEQIYRALSILEGSKYHHQ